MFGFLSSCAVQPAVEPLELSLPEVSHCLLGVGGEGEDGMGTAIRDQDGERPPGWEHGVGWRGAVVGTEQPGKRSFVLE